MHDEHLESQQCPAIVYIYIQNIDVSSSTAGEMLNNWNILSILKEFLVYTTNILQNKKFQFLMNTKTEFICFSVFIHMSL
jgi:hypothetical protein